MASKIRSSANIVGTPSDAGKAPAHVHHHVHVDATPQPARLTVWGTLVHELGAAESDEFIRQAKQLHADSKSGKLDSLGGKEGGPAGGVSQSSGGKDQRPGAAPSTGGTADKKAARAERLARTLAELHSDPHSPSPSSAVAVQFVEPTEKMERLQEKVGSIPNRLKTMEKLISGLQSQSQAASSKNSRRENAGATAATDAAATTPTSRTVKAGGSASPDKGRR